MTAFANSPARKHRTTVQSTAFAAGAVLVLAAAVATPAAAQRIENQVAVFAALDKVTARISKLEVKLGDTVKFGALKVTPRNCFSRPATEQPKTTTFVEVKEIELDGSEKPLFKGWMFAESPGLNAVEHPVYDVWLTECAQPKLTSQPTQVSGRPGAGTAARGAAQGGQPAQPGAQPPPPAGNPDDAPTPRRRPPR